MQHPPGRLFADLQLKDIEAERRRADEEFARLDAQTPPETASDDEFLEHQMQLSAALTRSCDLLHEAVRLRNVLYAPPAAPPRIRVVGRSRRERRPGRARRASSSSTTSSADPPQGDDGPSDPHLALASRRWMP